MLKTKTLVSKKLRQSAKGQECTLNIYPYCNGDPATTVSCHVGLLGKGIGKKSDDIMIVHGCYECHKIIDGQHCPGDIGKDELNRIVMYGLQKTLKRLIDMGIIKIA